MKPRPESTPVATRADEESPAAHGTGPFGDAAYTAFVSAWLLAAMGGPWNAKPNRAATGGGHESER